MSKAPEYHNIYELPAGLPVPFDDGACSHLVGMRMPRVALRSTTGKRVDLAVVSSKRVLFFFPAAGRPGIPSPAGWNDIPGARGCTPQICSFRDSTAEIQRLGFQIFGVSAQKYEDLLEIAQRNQVLYELLSDSELRLTRKLNLPTFEITPSAPLFPKTCIKRVTLIVESGRIRKVFYPVFPPDGNVVEVLTYLGKARNQ